MQQQMMAAQEELAEATVDGTVGDGLVTVTVNGTGDLVGVSDQARARSTPTTPRTSRT